MSGIPIRQSGIYRIISLVNGHYYIGSSINLSKRRTKHFCELRSNTHKNAHLQHAFNLYGENNFLFDIIEYYSVNSLLIREQFYINDYKQRGEILYNLSLIVGNNFRLGVYHTEETKSKMRIKAIGRGHTLETRKKISQVQIGKKLSEEIKLKMSKAHMGKNNHFYGKHHSDEAKQKISKANKK